MYKRQGVPITSPAYVILLALMLTLGLTACVPTTGLQPVEHQTPTSTSQNMQKATSDGAAKTPTPTTVNLNEPSETPAPDCMTIGGELRSEKFYSEVGQTDFYFQIYLPPCYQSNASRGYPVVYLLHGLSNDEDQWVRLGLVETLNELIPQGAITPFIAVLPRESRAQPPQSSPFSNMLVQELIPYVDANFNTIPEKAFRGIGGLSRGAAWAVQIGFENIALFDRIGAHSLPLFQADNGKITGWLTQEPQAELPSVFIDIGRDDPEWKTAEAFANLLDQYFIPHEWYFYTNGHTETYWSEHLEQYLRWYARDW